MPVRIRTILSGHWPRRFRASHVDVWYDEFSLKVGDSLREAIDRGLSTSRFGIIVLSPHFFAKRWPQRELNGFVAREAGENRQLVLPIWHGIDRDAVLHQSPPLADLFAVPSSLGLDAVVKELLKKIRPEESPLIVARDFLISKGVSAPLVTDEWWLDLVEVKESNLRFPDLNFGQRWIFPLPFPNADRGTERGLNIAWTALQMDWSADGEEQRLCQLSPPEQIHAFLRKWPGLLECARNNAGVLAMYAPQITIPGYDEGFADLFDDLMSPSREDAYEALRYGRTDTTDGKEPLCGELIAWRHPNFGNYTCEELSYSFVKAHNAHYSRQLFDGFECLIWLLSSAANWMPQRLRDSLTEGMRKRPHWWLTDFARRNALSDTIIRHTRSRFRFTRELKLALVELITEALQNLAIQENPSVITERFINGGFLEGYYAQQESWRLARRARPKREGG